MTEPYHYLPNQKWTDTTYDLLEQLHDAAKGFTGPPEVPYYYCIFDSLMAAHSSAFYGEVQSTITEETPEQEAQRLIQQEERHNHLSQVLEHTDHYELESPHPFDLERCKMALMRPWPDAEAEGQESLVEVRGHVVV